MKKIFTLLIFIFALQFASCDFGEDIEVGDAYNFKVIASQGSFTGYYIVNGGSTNLFSGEAVDGNYYSYEKNLSSPESVYVSVTGTDSGTKSISILIFADNELVSDTTVTQADSEVITAILHHTFNEEE